MIYTQTNPAWSQMKLGGSGLTMAEAGCFVTACAQIMGLAGYASDPGELCSYLDSHGGFTADGSAYWASVSAFNPALKFGGSGYQLVRGTNGATGKNHWWVKTASGTVYDPWTGSSAHPSGYVADGTYLNVGCSKAPVAVTVLETSAPVTSEFEVVTKSSLHFRDTPRLSGRIMVTYPAGTHVLCSATVTGDPVLGNARWCRSKLHGWYCSSEYVSALTPANQT